VLTRWIGSAALTAALLAGCGKKAPDLADEAAAARDRMCKCEDRACGEAAAAMGRAFRDKLRARYPKDADVPAEIRTIGQQFQACRESLEARLGVAGGPAHGLRGIQSPVLGHRPPVVRPAVPAPTPAPPTPGAGGPVDTGAGAPMAPDQLDDFRARIQALDSELRAAQHDLDAATTDAERHQAQAHIDALARNRREVTQQLRAAKRGGH